MEEDVCPSLGHLAVCLVARTGENQQTPLKTKYAMKDSTMLKAAPTTKHKRVLNAGHRD